MGLHGIIYEGYSAIIRGQGLTLESVLATRIF